MLRRLERAVERIVEGTVGSAFRLRVQPAEIGRRLERAMLEGRVTSVGTTLGPNAFEVRLHPEDAASFADWAEALGREMETWLAELAYARGIATVGPIRVQIREDPMVPRRSVIATGRFDAAPAQGVKRSPTRAVPMRLVPELAGGPEALLAGRSLSVGRADDNDLVLASVEVSRHHARLEWEPPLWRVTDLQSTNGTWLNGARVATSRIGAGDRLAFGDTRFIVLPE